MWNAIELIGNKYGNLNLQIAAMQLAEKIRIISDFDLNKLNVSKGNKKRILRCKKELNKRSNNNVYKSIYKLIQINGLSLNTFRRTLESKNKSGYSIYYINYKYLSYIIESILNYILIIDYEILNELLKHSSTLFKGEDTITYRFIPIRKSLIEVEVESYTNNESGAIKFVYFRKKIFWLNKQLEELNARRKR